MINISCLFEDHTTGFILHFCSRERSFYFALLYKIVVLLFCAFVQDSGPLILHFCTREWAFNFVLLYNGMVLSGNGAS